MGMMRARRTGDGDGGGGGGGGGGGVSDGPAILKSRLTQTEDNFSSDETEHFILNIYIMSVRTTRTKHKLLVGGGELGHGFCKGH